MKKSLALIMSLIMIFSTFSVCAVSANAATAAPAAVSTQEVDLENDFALIFKGIFREILNGFMKRFGVKKGFYVTGVDITQSKTSIDVNKSVQLKATLEPENVKDNSIIWQIEDSSIATVNANGIVTGKKAGLTKVYAIGDGGFYDSCTVNIKKFEENTNSYGKCGENLNWHFYPSNGSLVITGTGPMYNYDEPINFNDNEISPWYTFKAKIKSVALPNGLTTIGSDAFYECSEIESIIIPNTVTEIKDHAFAGCSKLKNIEISNNVKSIGEYAFSYCTSLVDFVIPDGINYIEYGTFKFCTSLKNIIIPVSVTAIGSCAFEYCTALTEIKLHNNITSIGTFVFDYSGYYNNESNWENGVLYLGNYLLATKQDFNTDTYEIKQGTTVIASNAFYGESRSVKNIIIPNTVKTIPFYAFSNENLESITIPNSITKIEEGAFRFCKALTNITIPSSVTVIEEYAFDKCDNLSDVYFTGSESEWNSINVSNYGNSALFNATIHTVVKPVV